MKLTILPLLLILILFPVGSMAGLVPSEHELFEENQVQEIRIYFDQEDYWEILEDNFESETYLQASFEWENCNFETVGVRFKGGSSYQTNPTMKKSFKIDFDVFIEDQNISGLYIINLNCNFNDPSFVREAAAYEISAAAGLTCPRTTFAALYINDTYWGLYTLVEQFDKHFIEERFGDSEDGNLWKGDAHGSLEFLGWSQDSYYGNYELKTNESANDWTSLINLANTINNTETELLPDSLSEVLDVHTALALLAVDNLLVNLDSYAGRCVNYYLYCADRDDRFVISQWDTNESWGIFNMYGYSIEQLAELEPYWTNPQPNENRPLATVLWANDDYRDVYEGILLQLMATSANPDTLLPRIEEMRDLVREWVYLEEAPRRLFTANQFDNAMDYNIPIGPGRHAPALAVFIENRHDYLTDLIGSWEPENEIILNEMMAGNYTTVSDESDEFDDWIEVTNRGDEAINLLEYHLTDDMAFPWKYTFPDTLLQPDEYIVIWADKDVEQGELHAEFKLDKDGEEVYLLHENVIVDMITFPDIDDDISWGRWLDQEDNWQFQAYPTPGLPNSDEQEEEGGSPSPNNLGILISNPIYLGSNEITITGSTEQAILSIYDLTGRLIFVPFNNLLETEQSFFIETSDYASGIYILRLCQGMNTISRTITFL